MNNKNIKVMISAHSQKIEKLYICQEDVKDK